MISAGSAASRRREAILSDRRSPVRPQEKAAAQLPQLSRDVMPVPNPVSAHQHHADMASNPSVEQKVPRPRPVPHGVVNQPPRGGTDVGRAHPQRVLRRSGVATEWWPGGGHVFRAPTFPLVRFHEVSEGSPNGALCLGKSWHGFGGWMLTRGSEM